MKWRRSNNAGAGALASDDLLKIFAFLPPRSLARSCLVCSSWNKIITGSLLWKNIFDESSKRLLQFNGSLLATKGINILNEENAVAADWKAQYVKQSCKVSFVLGTVHVKEWKGHSKRVECCRFQMDTIVTGSSDGVVRSWSTITFECLATYVVPNKARIVDLEFDESKAFEVFIHATDFGCIWNRDLCLESQERQPSSPFSRTQSANTFTGVYGFFIRFRLLFGLVVQLLVDQQGEVYSCSSYVDPEVAIGCSDGTIRIFDVYSGRCARIFRQHSDRVTCIVVDTSASLLMSGSADGTVQLSDFTDGRQVCCLLPSSPPTEALCLHLLQKQSTLVGGTSSGHVHAWDVRKHKLLWSVRVGPSSITSLHTQFYDTSILLVGSINGTLAILDAGSRAILRQCVVAQDTKQSKVIREDRAKRNLAVAEHMGADLESSVSEVPRKCRPPILSLRTGMSKIVTTHPDGTIRLWQFEL